MTRLVLPLCVAACGGKDPTDTRDQTPPEPIALSCAQQPANTLRWDCVVTVARPVRATLTLREDGRPDRERPLELQGGDVVTLSGLAATTAYTWELSGDEVRGAEGAFTTGPLPPELPPVTVTGSGSVPYLLFGSGTWVMIADRTGRIVWYEPNEPDGVEPHRGLVAAYDWTGDGVVLHITSILRHIGLDGTERLHLSRGVDFERPLHHDVFWSDGRIFSMNAMVHTTPEGEFTYDGFYAFDDRGVIYEWDLFDHYDQDPPKTGAINAMWDGIWPGAEDIAHGNAVFEADDGTVLVSFRNFDEVWALAGIDAADAGAPKWTIDGHGAGDFAITADPAVTADADFDNQHHPRLIGNRLTLSDNRVADQSRVIALELDPGAGTAEIVASNRLGMACPIQGSNYELANGNVLATCCVEHTVQEFAAGSDELAPPIWTLVSHSDQPWMIRGVPIEVPPPGW